MNMVIALLLVLAGALERPPAGLPFKLLSAEVQDVRVPNLGVKHQRRYDRALVLRVVVDRKTYDSLPPDIAAYLYLGTHALHPFKIERPRDAETVVITFHDPDWKSLTEPVPMVLTTRHGDPIRYPQRYRDAPRFDPRR
jgi:hypothetical protein